MDFEQPAIAYTAATNVEAQLIVKMLQAKEIEALAVEDQSGVSLWAFGTISQFHRPNVWVEQSTVEAARALIHDFEREKRRRESEDVAVAVGDISAACEDCGAVSEFSSALDGTTQECPHCHAYMDVGDFSWGDDVGPDEE